METQNHESRITKRLDAELRPADGERQIAAKISTTAVDRDGDVMLPSGVDLSNFRKNPVVLFGHGFDDMMPVGTANKITKQSDGITVLYTLAERPELLPQTVEWKPDTLLHLLRKKVIRGHSIGFLIKDGGARKATEKDKAKFGDDVLRVITDWELLEFSIVPVPGNQDALAIAVSKGLISRESAIHFGLPQGKPQLSLKPVLVLNTLQL